MLVMNDACPFRLLLSFRTLRARRSMVMLLCVLMSTPALFAADRVEVDQWFVGRLNGQPALQGHALVTRHDAGGSTDSMETVLLIARRMGTQAISIETRETQVYEVDAQGRVQAFRFDHVENGTVTAASGMVQGGRVRGEVVRLGRRSPVDLPANQPLWGQQASQERLAQRTWRSGDREAFAQVALLGNQVQVVTSTAAFVARETGGNLRFDVSMDAVPVPMGMTITPTGMLAGMTMNLGLFSIVVEPVAKPVALAGAELDPVRLVQASGPAPRQGTLNRFRLATGVRVPTDAFQHQDGAVVTVRATAAPETLPDPAPLLRAEPQLETDDAALRAWVAEQIAGVSASAERAEHLRLAVRSWITTKDLSQADASALETFRSRRGDCTEHANLLAATLRIAGIPARVDVGLVYSAVHGGWVGHAWNSAYLDGGWVHLDSAYPGIPRSCYLRLGSAGGEWAATGAALLGTLGVIMGTTVTTL
jgi:hypothetical protein